MATMTSLTLEAFLRLPETEPASEHADGEVTRKTTPIFDHGVVQRLLRFVLTLYLRACPGGDAGSEIRCIFGSPGCPRAYAPDYIYVRAGRVAHGPRAYRDAPDLAVEILSPDDRTSQVMTKIRVYLENGVRLVWLIDPDRRTATVFTTPEHGRSLTESDTLDGGDVLPGSPALSPRFCRRLRMPPREKAGRRRRTWPRRSDSLNPSSPAGAHPPPPGRWRASGGSRRPSGTCRPGA